MTALSANRGAWLRPCSPGFGPARAPANPQARREPLRHLIETVGKSHLDAAEALGWFSEKLGQLKLRRDHSAGLGTFEALEMLGLGIQGKVSLWTVLPEIRKVDPRIPDLDFATLLSRAQTQYNQVEEQRLRLASTTFARASS